MYEKGQEGPVPNLKAAYRSAPYVVRVCTKEEWRRRESEGGREVGRGGSTQNMKDDSSEFLIGVYSARVWTNS